MLTQALSRFTGLELRQVFRFSAATKKHDWEVAAKELYGLLDDIDTLDSTLVDNTIESSVVFRDLALGFAEKRREILSSDGYSLTLK